MYIKLFLICYFYCINSIMFNATLIQWYVSIFCILPERWPPGSPCKELLTQPPSSLCVNSFSNKSWRTKRLVQYVRWLLIYSRSVSDVHQGCWGWFIWTRGDLMSWWPGLGVTWCCSGWGPTAAADRSCGDWWRGSSRTTLYITVDTASQV